MTETLTVHQHRFILHSSGAVYWENNNTVCIADVHLGKTTYFGKHGIAVPMEVIRSNYARMQEIIDRFNPEHLYFLGSLFQGYQNSDWEIFAHWISRQSVKITLITGNHEFTDPCMYEHIGIKVADELRESELFRFTHHPEEKDGLFNICGHLHPAVKLNGFAKQQIKLPCFVKNPNQLILPAFGDFTGNSYVDQNTMEAIFACTDKDVILVE